MTQDTCQLERFLRDVKDHKLEIIHDDGNFRHLRMKRPNTSCYYYDIITWAGYLVICGDMGSYTFARITDMFQFFREEDPEKHRINCGYWSEKLQGAKSEGVREFSPELFEEAVTEEFNNWVESTDPKIEDSELLLEALRDEVLDNAYDGESRAIDAAMEFSWFKNPADRWNPTGADFTMHDFYEHNCREYSFHFTWCLYAIVHAIREYDNAKT